MVNPLAARIRKLRGGRPVPDFAALVGLHPRTIYAFEDGTKAPSVASLYAIARATGADLDVLTALRSDATPRQPLHSAARPRSAKRGRR